MPGGTFFFTVVTCDRMPILTTPLARKLLRAAISACKEERPFDLDALILLPDHLHALWTLPAADADFSARWGVIKKHFTQEWLNAGSGQRRVSGSKSANVGVACGSAGSMNMRSATSAIFSTMQTICTSMP